MSKKPFFMAIAGGSGSGKSTVVDLIKEQFPQESIAVLAQDHYYKDLSHLTPNKRDSVNFDHPDAIDHELLLAHLKLLCQNKNIERPSYDFATHTRKEKSEIVFARPVLLLDGIFSLYFEKIRKLADLSVFIDLPEDLRFIRRLQRDMKTRGRSQESVIKQYLESVRPMHNNFVEPAKKFADLVLYWEERNEQATSQLAALLKQKF